MVIMRKLLTKPLNILDGKILRNLYCFSIKCFTIIFNLPVHVVTKILVKMTKIPGLFLDNNSTSSIDVNYSIHQPNCMLKCVNYSVHQSNCMLKCRRKVERCFS